MKKPSAPASSREREPIEFIPDAWERFERAVDAVSKSGPQHKPVKKREPGKPSHRPSEPNAKAGN